MYKVAFIKDSGKKIEVKEFEKKSEAFAVYMEAVNEQCENIERLKKFVRREGEVLIRGDLFFSREFKGHNDYIIIYGESLQENRRAGKYKQLLKKYKLI